MPVTMNKDDWKAFWAGERESASVDGEGWLRWSLRQYGGWKSYALPDCFKLAIGEMMARGKGNVTQKSSDTATQWTKFVDIPLVEAEWADIIKAYGNPDAIVDAISDLLESGYRVGLSHNRQNDAFIVSVTCKVEGDPNEGCTYNAFAETWFEACQIAVYKHFIKSKKVWSSVAGKDRPKFG
jgi:hypothetical protein